MARAGVIFLFTYLFIAGRRLRELPLGRTGGALVGAVLMVGTGVVPLDRVFHAEIIDWNTIVLLLGIMVQVSYLTKAGFFELAARATMLFARTPRQLLLLTMIVSGLLSAFLVNDPVCLMLTPLVLVIVRRAGLRPLPFLIALAASSNIGSALTLSGNPQNMIIASASELPYARFLVFMVVPCAVAGLICFLLLSIVFRREVNGHPIRPSLDEAAMSLDRVMMAKALGAFGMTLVAFLLGVPIPYAAMAGCCAVVLMAGRDPNEVFRQVDWPLLLFFASLFVVMGGLAESGLAERMLHVAESKLNGSGEVARVTHLTSISLVASQLFSNVPYVLIAKHWVSLFAGHEELFWMVLALTSTLAGNLTTVGSVANIIVLESARARGIEVGFRQYLRLGLPITLLTTTAAVAVLLAERWLILRSW